MSASENFDPDTEWLDHVRPTGLVVARDILKELGLVPLRQSPIDSKGAQQLIAEGRDAPALSAPWTFMQQVLEWPADRVAGVPDGPKLLESLDVRVPEHETTLKPDWAVLGAKGSDAIQLLVQLLPQGIDPDKRGALEGWEASAHQRFERLLRETKVFTGVLVSDRELRLVHAPGAETSGWLSFPLHNLGSVAGRAMLGGLKLLLGRASLFTNPENKRLLEVLKASRNAQASVSEELARQVLGALHELLRGLVAAEPDHLRELAADRPQHFYEGLLAVLMRLVFLLYAEDRGLLPSQTDESARALYDGNYSVRGLFARLSDDAASHPDTMDERRGAWGQLLALFRVIHRGDGSGWIVGRGGKLFDPEQFPFLMGRFEPGGAERVMPVSDGCLLRVLGGLMTLRGERLSYRTLDVEQIGSVYETVMGFTVERAGGPSIAIRAGKNNHTPVFIDCAALAKVKPGERQKTLKDLTERGQFSAAVLSALKSASDAGEIAAALGQIIDPRGSPHSEPVSKGTPILQPTEERRRTGSHYTPRDLTQPIVEQALAPVLERLGATATPEQVLDIKVCDPAMGSGAFLVEACRRVADRLVMAWANPGPRPAIPVDETEELHARRLVAQRCLYGVDKNPMATDLARLSIWLITLAREHEFTFLDHALKTGDSLIGLTREQITAAHWDTKPGMLLLRQLLQNRIGEALRGRTEIRDAPDDVRREIQEQRYRSIEDGVERIRLTGDAIVSAFFSAQKDNERETRRAQLESWFAGGGDVWRKVADAAAELTQGAHPMRPLHWEVEFPEVFARNNPGFDSIVGNPPFMGGSKISSILGYPYLHWLGHQYSESHGNGDLAAYFFRRTFHLLRADGTMGLVATNTISQGDTRSTGLRWICQHGGTIYAAQRRVKWPGEAAVVVSLVHLVKGLPPSALLLDGRAVTRITAFLLDQGGNEDPEKLQVNNGHCFLGAKIYGQGFTFDDNGAGDGVGQPTSIADMKRLIAANPKSKERIFPYIGGEEVNAHPEQKPHRFVIDFGEEPLDAVRKGYPKLLKLVEQKVKPERLKLRDNADGKRRKEKWWQFGRITPALNAAKATQSSVLVTGSSAVAHHMIASTPSSQVFSHKLIVFIFKEVGAFAVLQCRAHEIWSATFGTTLGDALTYNPTQVFQTFPFPERFDAVLEVNRAAKNYHDHRAKMMIATRLGLTRTHNRFHDRDDKQTDIVELRHLHEEMDRAVLRAYGWDDLAKGAKAVFLTEDIEDDPKYQGRLFWPADFRAEVLSRLLALNAERHTAEKGSGVSLPTGKKTKRIKGSSDRGQPILL